MGEGRGRKRGKGSRKSLEERWKQKGGRRKKKVEGCRREKASREKEDESK